MQVQAQLGSDGQEMGGFWPSATWALAKTVAVEYGNAICHFWQQGYRVAGLARGAGGAPLNDRVNGERFNLDAVVDLAVRPTPSPSDRWLL